MPFYLNQQLITTIPSPGMILLDFIRQQKRLVGTKEVCREGDCGACTVLVGELVGHSLCYKISPSCLFPLGKMANKHIVTIEGLNQDTLTEIQKGIIKMGATQCGFCTPGIVVALTGFFLNSADFSEQDALMSIEGNLCRCTGYQSIKRAAMALSAFARLHINQGRDRIQSLIKHKILPEYFADITGLLNKINAPRLLPPPKNSLFVAGGTDLFVQNPTELKTTPLYFLNEDPASQKIIPKKDSLDMGSGVTTEQLRTSKAFNKIIPDAHELIRKISSLLIREHATLAGNIVNASPIGDLAIIFLALDTHLHLVSRNGSRHLPLDKFFMDYKRYDLKKNEIIKTITVACKHEPRFFNFEKVCKRPFLDIASVNSALALTTKGKKIQKVRISAGGVAPVPLYLNKTSSYLTGKTITPTNINAAIQVAFEEISPISDVRGSSEYKRLLIGNIIKAHFERFYG